MRVVAGLGNPGMEYEGTRHNVGFAVVRELARRWPFGPWHHEPGAARITCGRIGRQRVVMIEPQLYMNRSGEALARLDIPIEPGDLIVIHDDIDLPPGRIRVKVGGGSAGHRGVESVARHYGPDFARVRVGVGRPEPGGDTAAYVLAPFTADEQQVMAVAIDTAADAVECILEYGERHAMSRFNARQAALGDASSGTT